MMRQYREMKAELPKDVILLFRLGDFYEMFFEDAKFAAPILDVTLTKRADVPMCGMPYHAIENYLPRLLEAGVKVAIAEQMEDPRFAKGIVKRKITRVITPGTVTDSCILSPDKNNFLAALSFIKGTYGLASLDISTGDFRTTEFSKPEELETELHRLHAAECLLPESLFNEWKEKNSQPRVSGNIMWTPLDDWIFATDTATELLKRHFKVASLDGFGCRTMKTGVSAAGAILHYVRENLRNDAGHIRILKTYTGSQYMVLDSISQRNLELVDPMLGGKKESTLLHVLDHTATPMGSRMLREWLVRPLNNKDAIIARLDAVSAFKDDPVTLAELMEVINSVRDLERIIARLNIGSANARDMAALAKSLESLPDIKNLLKAFDIPLICEIREKLHELPELVAEIGRTIADEPPAVLNEGDIIREGCNAELDELRKASTEGKNWIAELQTREQARSGIKSLKIRFNNVFGYYIEISRSNLDNIPADYVRKQTLVNGERFITPELKEMESKILGAEEKSKALEYEIFQKLRDNAMSYTGQILETASSLAKTDVIASFAECARKYNYCRPQILDDETLEIIAGRHPVLDATMKEERFVPNDTILDGDQNRMMIITGPNMAGKSTYIRQVALLVLLAQTGSYIPAQKAKIGLVDRIFTRVGAVDDISRGQSTFMVEMLETANILNHATKKSLVILDEIGRGTSTFDGISIAWAVAEYLHDAPTAKARTLFATHYHELTELALTCRGVKNYNVAVKEYGEQIIFLRQIVPGATDRSYGIHVAKLAGLPNEVITRANEILENLENNAIAEAGQPALAEHHEKKKEKKKEKKPNEPTLFDWFGTKELRTKEKPGKKSKKE
ncbi:MAG: DNA mismatch repair protein MutS [Lentisphaerae bacterium GWF2_50_93]|nr:MAG: DNA mismatch repair protein MutS [Lentisphaerae bacterium GWF2_50_93]